ncbi:NFACT family protein [Clostridium sp.]|uniref:NFACT family protein n=1 Tax=Clostridium sp. TaxID=1506 RepID=UPI003464B6CA
MALDGVFLYTIKEELKNTLINLKVDKVNQPEKDEIILTFRGNKKLLISASSSYPRIYLSKVSKDNPLKPPMFCMVLRKYLLNSRLIDISQLNGDRILVLKFEGTDDLGFNSVYNLIVEVMGRHSNITLVRDRDNIIMDSIKHITPDINSYRCLYPNIKYIYPPESKKLNPESFTLESFNEMSLDLELDSSVFSKIFTGISKILSKEMFFRFEKSGLSLYEFSKEFFKEYYELKNFHYNSYADIKGLLKEFSSISFETYNEYNVHTFDSPSELLDNYYKEKDKQDRIHNRTLDIQKIISNNIERCTKKIQILEDTLEKCNEKEDLRIRGELLTANISSLKEGMKEIALLNYYKEEEEYITIALNELKTPSENIQSYYKKYNKYKKAEESALVQLSLAEDELNYLNSVFTTLKTIDSYDEIDEIRRELMESGYIKFKKEGKKKIKPSKPLHFLSSDGYHIYVGKNNSQNDYLTLKFADRSDLWLHTKNIPGSHVIIKGHDIPDKTLEEAATLAAYYSKASNSSKVPIDYTEVRNVKKPSGSKPGMVIYSTNKTVYVDPKELSLEKL